MRTQAELLLIARLGTDLRPALEESVQRLIKTRVLKKGDAFYCAECTRDHINVWSGRGKQPQWIRELLAKGMSLQDLQATA